MEKEVRQYTLSGELVGEYPSIRDAAFKTGMNAKSISRCCTNKRKSYKGFVWIRVCDSEQIGTRLSEFASTVKSIEGEIWRDVPGYEGLYQVSSIGRVKTLDRMIDAHVGYRHQKEQIMSFYIDKNGYRKVHICKDSKTKNVMIHRLVCMTFIENPRNLPEVNHINGIKDDNRVENLEWCTRSENEQHAYDNGLAKGQPGHLRPMAKPIRLIHLATNKMLQFGCIADCARFFIGKQKNLEAALRYHANRKKKSQFRGYNVEFINN